MEDKDFYWLIGILEGEGSFIKGPPSQPKVPQLCVSMTDEDVIIKVANLLDAKYRKSDRGTDKGWKPSFTTTIRGKKAVDFMLKIEPYMSKRRKEQINKAVSCWSPREGKISLLQARDIRKEFKTGKSAKVLGIKYNVSHWYIYHIVNNKVLLENMG